MKQLTPSWRGPTQIQNAPSGYWQSGWAVASDENHLGQIDREVVGAMTVNRVIADYPGEDFYAYIWFSNPTWFAEIWKDHRAVGTETANGIDELITLIRKHYGDNGGVRPL